MKSIISTFLIILVGYHGLINQLKAQELGIGVENKLPEIFFDEDLYSGFAEKETLLDKESQSRGVDLDNLYKAKFNLVNGNLKIAKFYLNRINDDKSKIYAIKKRYKAIISFIEGDFKASLKELNDRSMSTTEIFMQVCTLKLLNYIALNKNEDLKKEQKTCLLQTEKYSKNDQLWLDNMIKLKLNDQTGLKKNFLLDVGTLTETEATKLWAKSGLFLNKEKTILDLKNLPEHAYDSKRLREIIAFMFLRENSPESRQKALSFVDDIDTANAENIKGSINMQNKEYELAFGHFQLALAKKQDSSNSLERAIPLAWALGQWKDGLSLIEKNTNKSLDPRKKMAIKIAFLIRDKQFKVAQNELIILKNLFKNNPPTEVTVMDNYVAMILAAKDQSIDRRKIEDGIEKGCHSFDGLNCWLALQSLQWDNLGKTISRDDEIFSDKDLNIEKLKSKKDIRPLKETVSVDQRDIEELDSAKIKILPK